MGLIGLNKSFKEVQEWLKEYTNKEIQIGEVIGKLGHFIVEPFLSHKETEEFYVCIYATRDGNCVLFHHEGGVNVGNVDAKARRINVDINSELTQDQALTLADSVPSTSKK